jgi:hypothetical protein
MTIYHAARIGPCGPRPRPPGPADGGGAPAGGAGVAAWSPNPKNPPFFFDLPSKDGKIQPDVVARWAANAPLAMIDQYVRISRSCVPSGSMLVTGMGSYGVERGSSRLAEWILLAV